MLLSLPKGGSLSRGWLKKEKEWLQWNFRIEIRKSESWKIPSIINERRIVYLHIECPLIWSDLGLLIVMTSILMRNYPHQLHPRIVLRPVPHGPTLSKDIGINMERMLESDWISYKSSFSSITLPHRHDAELMSLSYSQIKYKWNKRKFSSKLIRRREERIDSRWYYARERVTQINPSY